MYVKYKVIFQSFYWFLIIPFVMPRRRAVIGTTFQEEKLSAYMSGCHVSAARHYCLQTRGAAGHDSGGALLFGDFLLGTQEKVTRHQAEGMLKKIETYFSIWIPGCLAELGTRNDEVVKPDSTVTE